MRRVLLILFALGLCVSSPQLANAESGAHGSDTHHADGTHDDHGHGPKLETMGVDFMNSVWTIVIFVLLLLILRGAAWKPVLEILSKRESFITESLANAKKEREDAEALLKQYTEQVQKAKEEAAAIIEEGRRDAEAVKARVQQESRDEHDAMIDRARKDIEIARDTAVKSLYELTAKLATDVAGKIIEKELTPADHEKLVSDSISKLSSLEKAGTN